ncbi:MAG: aldose epimerase family protein [Clostridia bacterium]|nr:aldose epimerase family protein [Clostridia bacterium]
MKNEALVFTLKNRQGSYVKITNYGGIVMSLAVPNRNGELSDVVLGYDTPEEYMEGNPCYFGAICGRFANRIRGGRFLIDGREHSVDKNENGNTLHGGSRGFDKRFFDAEQCGCKLYLRLVSEDGDMGFEGRLEVTVCYEFTDDNELKISYEAVCDKDTVVSLTNHSYFNLAGHDSGKSVEDHILSIAADGFIPIDGASIPLGSVRPVDGTPFDFRKPTAVGLRLNEHSEQLQNGSGYDHCFAFGDTSKAVATLYEPLSGRKLEVFTDMPAIQLYSGNYIGNKKGKGGAPYKNRSGLALETEFYPNSPNVPSFPSPVLRAGETYRHWTSYRFSCE